MYFKIKKRKRNSDKLVNFILRIPIKSHIQS